MATADQRMITLERRVLLSQLGVDLSFGAGGYAPVQATAMLDALPDGKLPTAIQDENHNFVITTLKANGRRDHPPGRQRKARPKLRQRGDAVLRSERRRPRIANPGQRPG